MTPGYFSPSTVFPSGRPDPVEELKIADRNHRRFAEYAAEFLACAFPHVSRQVIEAARFAWVEMTCAGTEEQIKAIEEQRAFMAVHPFPAHLYPAPKTWEEELMDLVDERNKKQSMLDQVHAAFEGMRGSGSFPEELIPVLELQLRPLVDELEFTEKRLSDLQRSIEQRAHAESPATDTAEKSADVSGAD